MKEKKRYVDISSISFKMEILGQSRLKVVGGVDNKINISQMSRFGTFKSLMFAIRSGGVGGRSSFSSTLDPPVS